MLKLEKPAASDHAYVTLRENTRMFTPTFVRALGWAFCFHLGGLILFHVQPFRIAQTNTQYPPVQVKIEMALPDSAIYADLEVKDVRRAMLPEPAVPIPLIPRLSLQSPSLAEVFPAEKSFPSTLIAMEDPGELVSGWITLDPIPVLNEKTPQVRFLGPLANRSPILETLPNLVPPKKKSISQRGVYSVKIDDRTGVIFWYSNFSGDHLAQAAEEILQSLRFEPLEGGFVTEGQIELFLAGSGK